MISGGLSRHDRIRSSSDFSRVFQRGLATTSGPYRIHICSSRTPHTRLGLAVSKRVGNAVRRNRIKRMLREAFRASRHRWDGPLDVVAVALPHAKGTLEECMQHLDHGVQMGLARNQSCEGPNA